jgi:transposase
MHTHPNARLTPLGRERLLRRHIDQGEPLAVLAAQTGISLRTAYKWLARYRSGGHTSLADRVFAAPSSGHSIRSNCSMP